MKIKDIIQEGDVIKGKFGKGAKNPDIEIPPGYKSFKTQKRSDKVSALIGVKADGTEKVISTGHTEAIEALAKEYNSGGHAGTGIQSVSMLQAFGSEQMNILHKIGVHFMEKPFYWEDLDRSDSQTGYKPITEITYKKLVTALKKSGYELPVYSGKEIFGSDKRPKHCQVDAKFPKESTFVVKFDDAKYLCDTAGAKSYIRNWVLIK